jgi:uncharacterized alkaline shock family protein YloU
MNPYTVTGPDGSITVTPAALAQIVHASAESVDGARLRRPRRRLEVEVEDGRARVELELAARYGLVLPDLARAVQESVAGALGRMCEVEVERVDVSIEELEQ